MKAIFSLLILLFGMTVSGCADKSSTPFTIEPENAPIFHLSPVWFDGSHILFENLGAISIEGGTTNIDPDKTGIFMWNIESNVYDRIVPWGTSPAVSISESIIVAFVQSSIVIGTDNGWEEFEETSEWIRRGSLSIDHSGNFFAFRSSDPSHEVGIWVKSRFTNESFFVGPGFIPVWHPSDNILLYRTPPVEGTYMLIEKNFNSASADTIVKFPSGFSSTYSSYSPDGGKIAFFSNNLDQDQNGIRILDRESGDIILLTAFRFCSGINWGERGIVFSNACGDYANPGCGVLWLIDPESGEISQISQRLQFQ